MSALCKNFFIWELGYCLHFMWLLMPLNSFMFRVFFSFSKEQPKKKINDHSYHNHQRNYNPNENGRQTLNFPIPFWHLRYPVHAFNFLALSFIVNFPQCIALAVHKYLQCPGLKALFSFVHVCPTQFSLFEMSQFLLQSQ